ncbi:hypothetical protein ACQJBY_029537 [Aegilops geniculata]
MSLFRVVLLSFLSSPRHLWLGWCISTCTYILLLHHLLDMFLLYSGLAYEIKPKSKRVLFKDGLADTDDAQLLGPTEGELVDSTGEGLAGRTLGSTVGAIARKDNLPQLDIVAEKAGPALIDQTPNAKRSLLLPCSDADFRLLHTFSYFSFPCLLPSGLSHPCPPLFQGVRASGVGRRRPFP